MPAPPADTPEEEAHPLDKTSVMKEFPIFEIYEEIALKENIAVYRAKRKSDGLDVVIKVFDRKEGLIRRHKSQQLLDFENSLNAQLGPYVAGLVKYLEVKSTYNMFLHAMEPAKGSILQVINLKSLPHREGKCVASIGRLLRSLPMAGRRLEDSSRGVFIALEDFSSGW